MIGTVFNCMNCSHHGDFVDFYYFENKVILICSRCATSEKYKKLNSVERTPFLKEIYKDFLIESLGNFKDLTCEDLENVFKEALNEFLVKDIIE